jgi:hypothetical protein
MTLQTPPDAITAGAKVLYADDMSNGSGNNVPEIADACEAVVRKILTAAAPHMFAEILALMADPEHYDSQGPSEGYVSVENLRKAIEAAGTEGHQAASADPAELGYLCRHGHFIFHDDPDVDYACGSKRIAGVLVQPDEGVSPDRFSSALSEASWDFGKALGRAYE